MGKKHVAIAQLILYQSRMEEKIKAQVSVVVSMTDGKEVGQKITLTRTIFRGYEICHTNFTST